MWSADALVELAAGALRAREGELALEQAVHGLDSLSEVALHPLLAPGFAGAGFGVLRETLYPAEWRRKRGRRRALPDDPQRQRCDLVLTPGPGQTIADPLAVLRVIEKIRAEASGTLFEPITLMSANGGNVGVLAKETAPLPQRGGTAGVGAVKEVGAGDAYWLEVKAVGQFTYTDAFPGPNRTYTAELTRGIPGDLRKLLSDERVERGGVLLVHFTADEGTARHDLAVVIHRCLDKGIQVRSPASAAFPIATRIGNAFCTLSVLEPVRPAPEMPGAGDDGRGGDGVKGE
ncbi:hypothetical protein BH11PLA1_BH11PLA1_13790 [soil metagenome]